MALQALAQEELSSSDSGTSGQALVATACGSLQLPGGARMPLALTLPGGSLGVALRKGSQADACRRAALCRAVYTARLPRLQVQMCNGPNGQCLTECL